MPPPPTDSVPNFISRDVEINGTVKFGKSLTIHGRIMGDISGAGTLTLGENSTVQGDINVAAVSIHGAVKGNVTVRDRCELKGDARLLGDLQAPRLIMEEGATFLGMSKVGPVPAETPARTTRSEPVPHR
jgi:cytoskeletal protein CcmA (bactofilin family)